MILIRLLLSALTLLAIAYYLPGVSVSGLYTALIAAIALGIVNVVIKPILILLSLPITLLTLGLFTFVINGLLFWFVSTFIKGFEVTGFWPAFWGALIMTVVSWITGSFFKK